MDIYHFFRKKIRTDRLLGLPADNNVLQLLEHKYLHFIAAVLIGDYEPP